MGLILVVSEDLADIDTIKAALSVHGWWVTVAADSETAVQVAADQAPKLVVIDSELRGSLDLLRNFGAHNGGPGVLSLVPPGFDGALELKEAGGDEILTKPVSLESVLEAVQRCLAMPRAAPVEAPAAPQHLMTTEEIFGDVLREIEADDEAVASEVGTVAAAPAEPAAAPEPAPTPQPSAAAPGEELFAASSDTEPVVSLAGLFDESAAAAKVASPPAAEPAPEAPSIESEWHGAERRRADRPWSSPASGLPTPDAEELFEPDNDEHATVPAEPPVEPSAPAAVEEQAIDQFAAAEPPSEEAGEELSFEAEEEPEPRARRSPLLIGSLAAALLVVAGVVFVLNRGSEIVSEPAPVVEPIEQPAEPVAESEAVVAEPAPALEETPAVPPEVEPAAAAAPAASPAEPEDIDLEAIVDQELERREEELRKVFLEEEKRLLRELSNLDPGDEPADEPADEPVDEAAEDDGGKPDGVGR